MSGDLTVKSQISNGSQDLSKKKKRSQSDLETKANDSEEPRPKKKRKSLNGVVDDPAPDSDSKKSKKSKKDKKAKKSEVSVPSENPSQIDEDSQTEKPKKRSRNDEVENEDQNNDTSGEKKKKKRKNRDESKTPQKEVSASPSSAQIQEFLDKNSITITTPGNQLVTPCISFDQLKVDDRLRNSFNGFKQPTPIQACTWPPALEGRDVVGIAETGSGKTLAFGIPAMMRLTSSNSAKVTTLVVAPTRELAIQTHETLDALGKPFSISSVAIYGGVPKEPQAKMLANAGPKKNMTTRIIVGTPGRIIDLVNDGVCDLSNVDYLVLDEADRMLDKGFENDIRKIISLTKPGSQRQTMMFSATWPESVRRLASTFQQDPVRVTVGSDDLTANSRVEQVVEIFDSPREKDSRLLSHLRNLVKKNSDDARVLVFALYKKEASRVEQTLRQKGFSVGALHGDMSQNARLDALAAFKTGKTPVLVATDVAARGLDIPNVNSVINYTFPLTIEDYIHRIGRTGRGGKFGKSITFFTGENHEKALAGELARVLRESGFENEELRNKFPMTIKKKTHGVYGAFFREDAGEMKAPTRIVF